jgi:hypothetical protein
MTAYRPINPATPDGPQAANESLAGCRATTSMFCHRHGAARPRAESPLPRLRCTPSPTGIRRNRIRRVTSIEAPGDRNVHQAPVAAAGGRNGRMVGQLRAAYHPRCAESVLVALCRWYAEIRHCDGCSRLNQLCPSIFRRVSWIIVIIHEFRGAALSQTNSTPRLYHDFARLCGRQLGNTSP